MVSGLVVATGLRGPATRGSGECYRQDGEPRGRLFWGRRRCLDRGNGRGLVALPLRPQTRLLHCRPSRSTDPLLS